ncbi:hypothetical protein GJ496_010768 [Pomphorhynchus laevis]|nr:hypothetical protein GJ496_010768 [Pomphorhynchus laevis]
MFREVLVAGKPFTSLMDTVSTDNFIDAKVVADLNIATSPCGRQVQMTYSYQSTVVCRECLITFEFMGRVYENWRFLILPRLFRRYTPGDKNIFTAPTMNIEPITLFPGIRKDIRSICAKPFCLLISSQKIDRQNHFYQKM